MLFTNKNRKRLVQGLCILLALLMVLSLVIVAVPHGHDDVHYDDDIEFSIDDSELNGQ